MSESLIFIFLFDNLIYMKILYVITQSEYGGAQKYVCDLALNLGHDFEVFIAAGPEGNWDIFDKLIKNSNTGKLPNLIKFKHLVRSINPWHDILGFFEIIKVLKEIKPDVVHFNSSKAGVLGSLAAKITGVEKVVFTAHGWVFNEPMNFIKKWFYLFSSYFSAFFQDIIICVSEYDRKVGLDYGIAPENKLITVHNGIEEFEILSRYMARNDLSLIIKNKGIHWDRVLIGTVANLYKTKGLDYLIRAIYFIKTNNPTMQFQALIIGDGIEKKRLIRLIRELKLWDIVFIIDVIPGFKRYLKAFDLFVLSSVKEGLPYVILEAMMAGLPVVATRVGGIPEIIEDRINGYLIESKNERELADKVFDLVRIILYNDNTDQLDKIGKNARDKIKKEFSFSKMVDSTKQVYKS